MYWVVYSHNNNNEDDQMESADSEKRVAKEEPSIKVACSESSNMFFEWYLSIASGMARGFLRSYSTTP